MGLRFFGSVCFGSVLVMASLANTMATETFPIEAESWGGRVRQGPSMDAPQLTSLKQGDRLTILERSGEVMNGFPWFRIKLPSGRIGYQWGGILCAISTPIEGVFQTCSWQPNSVQKASISYNNHSEPQQIRFKRGTRAMLIAGDMPGGKKVTYTLIAKAGQELTVDLTSAENNAVFQLYPDKIKNQSFSEKKFESDIKRWNGLLTATGKYIIVVGSPRGDTAYQLYVAIR